MTSIKKDDLAKLESLKGESKNETLKLISAKDLKKALAEAGEMKAKAKFLLDKVDVDIGELKRAVSADSVVKETIYNLEQLDPEYKELTDRAEAIERQLGGSATVVGNIGGKANVREELRAAKLCLSQTKNIVSDAVAVKFQFESYSEVRNIIKSQQYKA